MMLTTKEVAVALKITRSRVLQLIAEGKISATKYGRDWQITREAISKYKEERKKRYERYFQ